MIRLLEKLNKYIGEPDKLTRDDIVFDRSRSWSLYIEGYKLDLPVTKFGAFRNYEGGGVHGRIQHNGREKENTVELGEEFMRVLKDMEWAYAYYIERTDDFLIE